MNNDNKNMSELIPRRILMGNGLRGVKTGQFLYLSHWAIFDNVLKLLRVGGKPGRTGQFYPPPPLHP